MQSPEQKGDGTQTSERSDKSTWNRAAAISAGFAVSAGGMHWFIGGAYANDQARIIVATAIGLALGLVAFRLSLR